MRFLLLALPLLALSACGKDDSKSTSNAVFRDENPCSQDVINDNNAYVRACASMVTMEDAKVCKREAEKFVAKYPGLNCKALKEKDQTPFNITEASVREVIRKLTEIGV